MIEHQTKYGFFSTYERTVFVTLRFNDGPANAPCIYCSPPVHRSEMMDKYDEDTTVSVRLAVLLLTHTVCMSTEEDRWKISDESRDAIKGCVITTERTTESMSIEEELANELHTLLCIQT
jgi:hypothetical protein